MSARLQGTLLLLVTATAWGLNWPVLKFVVHSWPPFTFRLLSGIGGLALMFLVAALRGERLGPPVGQVGRVLVAGVLNITSWMGLMTLSLFWLDAAEAAIIAYTMPIWAAIIAWPVLGERPTWPRVAGLAFGLSGVAVLLGGQVAGASGDVLIAKLPGVACIMGTALMFACGAVFTKRYPIALQPAANVAWQLVAGSLPLAVVAILFDGWDLSGVPALGWWALGYVAVIAMCVAYLAWFGALKLLPASSAAVGILLVPVIGVFSSALVLGEPLGVARLVALGMTVTGVALASRG